MIRARDILEEYSSSFKNRGHYVEIFVNPSRKEMSEIGSDIRFIADDETRKVYIWDAEKAFHLDIYYYSEERFSKTGKSVKIEEDEPLYSNLLEGIGIRKSGDYVMIESHALDGFGREGFPGTEAFLEDFLGRNWSWVDRYVRVTPYIARYQDDLDYLRKRK
jgi:hypothetical protein